MLVSKFDADVVVSRLGWRIFDSAGTISIVLARDFRFRGAFNC